MTHLDRTVVHEGEGERLLLIEKLDGSFALLRQTDFDSGPQQACPIPAAAIEGLRMALWRIGLNRACARLAEQLKPLREAMERVRHAN